MRVPPPGRRNHEGQHSIVSALLFGLAGAQEATTFTFETEAGALQVTPLGHASSRPELGDTVIHVDPWGRVADYGAQPDADWVWVTHEHGDHLDLAAIGEIATDATRFLMDERTAAASGLTENVTVAANSDVFEFGAHTISTVPAYNVVRSGTTGRSSTRRAGTMASCSRSVTSGCTSGGHRMRTGVRGADRPDGLVPADYSGFHNE